MERGGGGGWGRNRGKGVKEEGWEGRGKGWEGRMNTGWKGRTSRVKGVGREDGAAEWQESMKEWKEIGRIEEEQGRRKWRGQIRDFKLSIRNLKKMLENQEVQERRSKGMGMARMENSKSVGKYVLRLNHKLKQNNLEN